MELIPVITGPTGAGKTDLSLQLARRWDAEIVSADSRQIYRRMDIGTAKPTAAERDEISHHLIDERRLDEPVSAGEFARMAWERIADLRRRGRNVIVVGGSTLYVRAITEGIAALPSGDQEVREELAKRLSDEGSQALYAELARLDPDAAATMDASKSQRIIRALEVLYSTGRRISDYHKKHVPPPFRFRVAVVSMDRSRLYDRIERRVDSMVQQGLETEVRDLVEDYGSAATPLSTIGYREIIDHFAGAHTLEAAIELIKRNSRRYAKRQLTWYRSGVGYSWFDAESDDAETVSYYFESGSSDL